MGGKLPTGKKKTDKFSQGNYTDSSGITACMWIQVCIGHSGVYYRNVSGRLFVSYKSYLVFLKYMIG